MEEVDRIFNLQIGKYQEIRRATASQRIDRLRKLQKAILARRKDLEDAVYTDLRKSVHETGLSELYPVLTELKHSIKHLKRWMKPVRVKNPLTFPGARGRIHFEPRGVVLILAPWNFPFQLAMGPLVSALAAGNCIVLKPSEISAATSAFLCSLIRETFPEEEVAVIEGGAEVASALLEKPFHHIFFTGSPAVGKIVMQAAAKHLTSVTLELGGKSPVILDDSYDVNEAAKKIIWGKMMNAGQACVAPDYVLVPEQRQSEFVQAARKFIALFYGKPQQSDDLCRIINDRHHARIRRLIEDATARGAVVETGGAWDEATRYMAPTILTNVPLDSLIMEEEIFGPVLPVVTYKTLSEAIALINKKDRPLSLYIFSKNRDVVKEALSSTSAGGTCINDVVVHYANVELPFGGINNSGFGNSHGFYGFRAFSHERAVLKQPKHTTLSLLYPPYTEKVKKLIDLTLKYF